MSGKYALILKCMTEAELQFGIRDTEKAWSLPVGTGRVTLEQISPVLEPGNAGLALNRVGGAEWRDEVAGSGLGME